jgi:deoxyuridine 5'-triphosphate nucleotidohydrolase
VRVARLPGADPAVPLPAYQSAGAAGMDLAANLPPEARAAGIDRPRGAGAGADRPRLAIPEGFEVQLRPRSGLALREGLTLLNSPGTIDSDYRGEVGVIVINHGAAPVTIEPRHAGRPDGARPRGPPELGGRRRPRRQPARRRRLRLDRDALTAAGDAELSRKTALALEAVLDVAYNARPDPVQSRDITERQGIPHRYLEQVLQRLVRDGILKGVRGPRGGYTLARERRRVTSATSCGWSTPLEASRRRGRPRAPSSAAR